MRRYPFLLVCALLAVSCASQPEGLDASPPEGCPATYIAACDAGFAPCVDRCKGEFNFELPLHCLAMCRNDKLSCYARCPQASSGRKP
jgi:hypothetical protein